MNEQLCFCLVGQDARIGYVCFLGKKCFRTDFKLNSYVTVLFVFFSSDILPF